MREFKITENLIAYTEYYENSRNWGHRAWLEDKGMRVLETKIVYQNRTWESYEFESVLYKLYDLMVDSKEYRPSEERAFLAVIKNGGKAESERIEKMFGSIAMVDRMGEIFWETKEQKNSWKERMIKAGLGEGITMPSDWEELSEEEKEKRINGVIEEMSKK